MTPFVVELGAFGVGLDIAPGANRAGRALRSAPPRRAGSFHPCCGRSFAASLEKLRCGHLSYSSPIHGQPARACRNGAGALSRRGAAAQNSSRPLLRAHVVARRSRLRRALNDLRIARPRNRRLLSCNRTATTHSFEGKRGLSDPLVAPARAAPPGIIDYRGAAGFNASGTVVHYLEALRR